jgi:hypothetical protein
LPSGWFGLMDSAVAGLVNDLGTGVAAALLP